MISISILGSELSLGRCLWLCLFGVLTIISVQSPILQITEQNLADHMVIEHTIFFFLGAASVRTAEIILRILVSCAHTARRKFSYQAITMTKRTSSSVQPRIDINWHNCNDNWKPPLLTTIVPFWSNIVRTIFSVSSRYGFLWISIPIILLAIWHYPPLFDYATLHENVHILQHISFIVVGATGFIALRTLGESFKIIILITLNAIMAFAGLLFSVTTDPVYSLYSVSGHNEAGIYMLVTCIVLLLIGLPAYLIHRALFHIRIRIKEENIGDDSNN